jgi:hypothetical protein
VSDDSRLMSLPPFPPDYRASGLLLHVTSLPSQTPPGAAASLREGLDETLTLQRLGVTGALYRTLRGTNAIERTSTASSATSCATCGGGAMAGCSCAGSPPASKKPGAASAVCAVTPTSPPSSARSIATPWTPARRSRRRQSTEPSLSTVQQRTGHPRAHVPRGFALSSSAFARAREVVSVASRRS